MISESIGSLTTLTTFCERIQATPYLTGSYETPNRRQFSTATKPANPTFAQAGITPTGDVELLQTWYVVAGEQMSNEETIQLEEAKMVAEPEAWERLHEAIFKELFPPNRNAKSTNLRDHSGIWDMTVYAITALARCTSLCAYGLFAELRSQSSRS